MAWWLFWLAGAGRRRQDRSWKLPQSAVHPCNVWRPRFGAAISLLDWCRSRSGCIVRRARRRSVFAACGGRLRHHRAAAEPSARRGKPACGTARREGKNLAPLPSSGRTTASLAGEQPVAREELVKGYEYEKGQYVVLEDEELERITPSTSKEMQIVEFVNLAEIDPIFYETSYYVVPGEVGERPYSLLFEAMRGTGYAGLAQLAMHRREHIVVLRPGEPG